MAEFNREHITKQLALLDRLSNALFCLLCVERLAPCFYAFCVREGIELYPKFMDVINSAYKSIADGKFPTAIAAEIDLFINDSDEYGDPLAVQAQAAGLALYHVFETEKPNGIDAGWAASAVMDSIDNVEYFLNEEYGFDTLREVWEREELKQQTDLDELKKGTLTINELRSKNACYCIRPAC